MKKVSIALGSIEIEKRKIYHHRNLILLEDVDIDNILVPSMVSSGGKKYKYFIGYVDNNEYIIKPIHIMLPKMSAYVKGYDSETKWLYFLIDDGEFLKIIMIFEIKLPIVWKSNFIAHLCTTKSF